MKNPAAFNNQFGSLPILIVLFVIYSAALVAGTYYFGVTKTEIDTKKILIAFNDPESSIFLNLNGGVRGKISEIKDGKAWLETEKGGKLILSIQDNTSVYEFKDGRLSELGKSSKDIRLNEMANINIRGFLSGFGISSVTYGSSFVERVEQELLPEQ